MMTCCRSVGKDASIHEVTMNTAEKPFFDNEELLAALTDSYLRQLQLYRELSQLVQKALSQLVLSRGDAATIMAGVVQKGKIIDMLMEERKRIKTASVFYQSHKYRIPASPSREALADLLEKTEKAIKEFLEGEDQLKRYLKQVIEKSRAAVPCPDDNRVA